MKPPDWSDLVPVARLSLDERQVEALRRGDLAGAFGPPFDTLNLADPLPLPGGRMTLVHRVETLDPAGGRFGLGLIRAEADIHPDDWFMVCHFVDDHVMPGTLMYECCLHTLRIFLMRLGWVGASGQIAFEPLPGVANRLRCRGQVIESTRRVVYEVVIKELGYGPEPFAIADALMYADGKPIVEITDMALRLTGTNRQELEQLWRRCHESGSSSGVVSFARQSPAIRVPDRVDQPSFTARSRFWRSPRASPRRVLAIATASSTTAASSPGFPGLPTSSWTGLSAWKASPGRWPREPRPWPNTTSRTMPGTSRPIVKSACRTPSCWRSALQACGWVAAYMGSALASSQPLKFRNLGGTACQHAVVGPRSGTLRTEVKATKVTRSAGMIIQHYEFSIHCNDSLMFDGATYFGFFHPEALAEQVGHPRRVALRADGDGALRGAIVPAAGSVAVPRPAVADGRTDRCPDRARRPAWPGRDLGVGPGRPGSLVL